MEIQLLRDPEVVPTNEVLEKIVGKVYPVLDELIVTLTAADHNLTLDWNYYKDGKSWLGKLCYKKKTVCWLSVWDGFFRISFFFTEKHLDGFAALEVDETLKNELAQSKPVGRLLPLLINISHKKQLPDVLKIAIYKKNLK